MAKDVTTPAVPSLGCIIVGDECLVHGKGELGYGEVACSHMCTEAEGYFEHSMVCDDPPPPAHPLSSDTQCFECGRVIRTGELGRYYEEGWLHADGCPEGPMPS